MLKIIKEITDDINISQVENLSDYFTINELYHKWFKDNQKSSINNFTEDLVRDLLMRSSFIEFEFKQLSYDGYLLCQHLSDSCICVPLVNIKKIFELAGNYEYGLLAIFNIMFPGKDIFYKRENETHINISPNSKSKLGKELWNFLNERFKLQDTSEYVSILDLVNSNLVNGKNDLTINSHITPLINLIEEKVKYNSDLKELLVNNYLQFAMYENYQTKEKIGVKLDIYNMWITELFDKISEDLRQELKINCS